MDYLLDAESSLSTMYAQHVVVDVLQSWLQTSTNPALGEDERRNHLNLTTSTKMKLLTPLLRFAKLSFLQNTKTSRTTNQVSYTPIPAKK